MQSILIGHRGEPTSYPENSLSGFEAVLQAGAVYIETDVQITADGVPVLCHDPDVSRLTGHEDVVMQTDYATLRRLPAGYPARFGTRFADARISRLGELASLLKRWLLRTHQGTLSCEQLDSYLDEFTFLFNRRTSKYRGRLFHRLVAQVIAVEPSPFSRLATDS